MSDSARDGGGDRGFPATSWSLICSLKDAESEARERHLRRLVSLYWKPVFCVVRHSWAKTDQDAEDLTQQFFAKVILQGRLFQSFSREKGSFRGFMRGAITRFLMSEARHATRHKRGGQVRLVRMDPQAEGVAGLIPTGEHLTPDQVFDAAWTRIVVARALEELEEKLRGSGNVVSLEVFTRYELASPGAVSSYAEVAEALGLSVDRVKHALVEARTMFRDIVTDLVREYVDGPEELERELSRLLGA